MAESASENNNNCTSKFSIGWYWLLFIVVAIVSVLILVSAGFFLGKHSEQRAELATKEKIIKHTLDSLKTAYATTEKSKDSVRTQIVTQTNTIIKHEKEVVTQAASIQALPFTMVGPNLKLQLEAAQTKPWVIDTNIGK